MAIIELLGSELSVKKAEAASATDKKAAKSAKKDKDQEKED